MSDPTFILSSAPSALPPSAPLNLLPFSLGPSSSPYTSDTVPISSYFAPRPSPAGNSGVPTGQPLASFRGRQVVGQTVSVPRGYRGVLISASRRPELGFEHREGDREGDGVKGKGKGKAMDGKWPLTPASSAASVSGASSIAADEDGSNGVRRSPRKSAGPVRGAGQVALSRPKTRQVQTAKPGVAKRRFRLDSDDEDGEDEQNDVDEARSGPESRPGQQVQSDETRSPSSTLLRTPSKRSRANPSSTVGTPKSVVASPSLPSIVIQEPTPRKEPLPPALRSLKKDGRRVGGIPPVLHEGDEQWVEDVHVQNDETVIPQPELGEVKDERDDEGVVGDERPALGKVESTIIPSPATEDDPPAFEIEDKPTVSAIADNDNTRGGIPSEQGAGEGNSLVSGPVRLLRPVARFDSFTLWTPDAPLAGFRAGESDQPDEATGESSKVDDAEGTEAGIKVRPGWWRIGGAGEGGDEVVRAMGEWLGLVEMVRCSRCVVMASSCRR
jgi:hypothetical protein